MNIMFLTNIIRQLQQICVLRTSMLQTNEYSESNYNTTLTICCLSCSTNLVNASVNLAAANWTSKNNTIKIYTVFHNYQTLSFYWHNSVNMWLICTKISRPERKIMLCEVLLEFLQPVLPLPVWHDSDLINALSIWWSDSGTPVCVNVSKWILCTQTYPVVLLRLLLRKLLVIIYWCLC